MLDVLSRLCERIPYGGKELLDRGGLFRAAYDLQYDGLPILENAIVFKTAESIAVNDISYEALRNYGILNRKHDSDTFEGIDRFFWNYKRFIPSKADELNFLPMMDDIQYLRKLSFKNIEFSSLMYHYNISKRSLNYFINTSEIAFFKEQFIVPPIAEVVDDYVIVPLTDPWLFYGLPFITNSKIMYENGLMRGAIGETMFFKIINHPTLKFIAIRKGGDILVDAEGNFFCEKYESSLKKYRIKAI